MADAPGIAEQQLYEDMHALVKKYSVSEKSVRWCAEYLADQLISYLEDEKTNRLKTKIVMKD